jgi:hypothetical protein
MKKMILTVLTLLVLMGCDAPVRTRQLGKAESLTNPSNSNSNSMAYDPGTLSGTTTSTGTTPGGPTTGTTPSASTEPGFTSCDLTNRYSSSELGSFGLCQSTVTESSMRVRFARPSQSTRNCLIPLYKDGSGNSTYIGQPQCTLVNAPDAVITGSLPKNRSGFESYPINGVLVMKEAHLPAYYQCMHAYINWIPQACPSGVGSSPYCGHWLPRCPYGTRTNPACDAAARDYMSQVCNAFKTSFSNAYVDIRTK